ncbi:serine/threonine protein kinase [Allocatelliglobosispora scoriae]|uniref:non-specific serine/threonine protein kinase n=1 Tax=Allocatelliglobosispora scoriae TaxID=643052 RepID=A0A841C6K4_9ACTN|nr:serine/threonine-protein kinase [Allocatelliglobosispora scoriae]MBB5874411.1 serine/threonine protein kinase [Allocatelliglobosispora scoriae]
MPISSETLVGDRYRLIRQLGQGGMGRVWQGLDEVLGRDVALKELVVPPGLSEEERQELRERSAREARAIARLSHPNVVRVFDVFTGEGGDPWIVMEYVRGVSLHDAIPVPPRRAAEIGLGVLAALQAAHRAGVVHRDVKPGNVMLSDEGRVLLTDFGIATAPGDSSITRTGIMFGSPAFMAPERVHDSRTGPSSDLWSLGATLYTAVEGHSPFERSSPLATLTALVTEPLPPPQHAGVLRPALDGLLQKDPADRISAERAEQLLRAAVAAPLARAPLAIAAPPAIEAAPPVSPPRAVPALVATGRSSRRIPRAALLGGAAVLLIVAVLAGVLLTREPDRPSSPVAQPSTSPATISKAPVSPKVSPSPTPTPRISASPSPAPSGFQLPAGWQMRDDGTGFAVPVPNGWRFGRDSDGRAYWRHPSNGTLLLIDQTRHPKSDPVKDWRNNEAARRSGYRDYARVRLEAVDYWDKAADWEFTYTSSGGAALHVLNRGFVTAPDQAYSIYWSTAAGLWNDQADELQVVITGFRPARS